MLIKMSNEVNWEILKHPLEDFHITEDFSYFFRLLVGAPLAQNLQPKTNRSGGLFKCPITQNTDDCVQVITDGRRSMY